MKRDMTIKEFCKKHNACEEGRDWSLKNCKTMKEVWKTAKPDWVIWIATRPGVLDDRSLRLFACWSVRQIWDLLKDERLRRAVDVAERFANGKASADELAASRDAARSARSAMSASWDSAMEAASAAARAARSAARADAHKNQSEYLRSNFKPNFKAVEK